MYEYVGDLIDIEHFNNKIDRSDATGCHPWTGARRGQDGRYGAYAIGPWGKPGTRYIGAHRVALELKLGRPIKPGYLACHSCDNRICCNPEHLWEGTPRDNALDSKAKGRNLKGRKRSEEFKAKTSAAHKRRDRYRCGGCDMVTEMSGLSSHQKASGHSGKFFVGKPNV